MSTKPGSASTTSNDGIGAGGADPNRRDWTTSSISSRDASGVAMNIVPSMRSGAPSTSSTHRFSREPPFVIAGVPPSNVHIGSIWPSLQPAVCVSIAFRSSTALPGLPPTTTSETEPGVKPTSPVRAATTPSTVAETAGVIGPPWHGSSYTVSIRSMVIHAAPLPSLTSVFRNDTSPPDNDLSVHSVGNAIEKGASNGASMRYEPGGRIWSMSAAPRRTVFESAEGEAAGSAEDDRDAPAGERLGSPVRTAPAQPPTSVPMVTTTTQVVARRSSRPEPITADPPRGSGTSR